LIYFDSVSYLVRISADAQTIRSFVMAVLEVETRSLDILSWMGFPVFFLALRKKFHDVF